jgi:hypothetical protein
MMNRRIGCDNLMMIIMMMMILMMMMMMTIPDNENLKEVW